MYRNFLSVLFLFSGTLPVLADGMPLPLHRLPDPDPLLLEHTIDLQRRIYTSSLELQYARNLDQLCKAQPAAERCEGYEPGVSQSETGLPRVAQQQAISPGLPQNPQQFLQQTVGAEPPQPRQPSPIVEEVSGSTGKLTAILSLPSGERRAVHKGDVIEGVGRVSSIDRNGVSLVTDNGVTRLSGGR